MKLAVCLLGFVALATASVVMPTFHRKVADQTFLMKQKAVLELVFRLQQTAPAKIYEDGSRYDIVANMDKYNNIDVVKSFVTLYKMGMLPQGEVFSIFYDQHRLEVIKLFDLFYYAKDFDTFYKTAAFARVHLNAGQFYYALSVAVLHREDTRGIVLPAPYEIYPQLFVDNSVIQMATEKRMVLPVSEYSKVIVIPVTRAGMYPYYQYNDKETHRDYKRNDFGYDSMYHSTAEDRIAYFTEDVALNTYYNYLHLDNPFWMNKTYNYKSEYRGELFYYTHQQLLARYVLERFSNDLVDVEVLDFDRPLEDGYNPEIRYPNGEAFPIRADHTDLTHLNAYEIELIMDFEARIRSAIDSGYIFGKDGEKYKLTEERGMDYLGKLIEATVDSAHYNYYGKLYHLSLQVIGHIHSSQVVPGVTENYETLLRDPAYYRLLARINRLFLRYKSLLPKYLREQFFFPGVKIESVEMEKLVTYFEEFNFDISTSVMTRTPEEDMTIHARQFRMNHKPFTYKINVNSDKVIDATVRVFIGPKYDSEGRLLSMNEKRRLMVELDRFPYQLTSGANTIARNSRDIFSAVEDFTTLRDLYKAVSDAIQGKADYSYDETDRHCGFPHRLLLPKGKRGGMPFTFFVAVTPYIESQVKVEKMPSCDSGYGLYYPDQYALGYPFDRVIDETQFYVPNFFEKDVIIFHKRAEEINNQSI